VSAVLLRGRAVLRRRWRAWIGLGLVLGGFGGISLAFAEGARRTVRAYPEFVRAENAADVVMAGQSSFGLVGSVDLERVMRSPYVAGGARAFVGIPFSGTVDGGRPIDVTDMLPVASSDPQLGTTIERWKVLAGRVADPARVDEATASFELARRLHMHVGSVVQLHFYRTSTFLATAAKLFVEWPARLEALGSGQDAAVTDPADGAVVRVRVTGIEASPLEFPPLLTDLAPVLHLTPAFAARYRSTVWGSPIAYLRLRSPSDLQAFQLGVERMAGGKPVSFISTLVNQQVKVQRSIRAESLVLALLSVLVAVAGAIALAQALIRQAFAESGDDDTLRALGMTRGQLLVLGVVRAASIGLVGALVALVAGWLLAPSMLLSLATKANLATGLPFDVTALAWGALAIAGYAIVVGSIAVLIVQRSTHGIAEPAPQPRLRGAVARPWVPLSAALGIRFALQRARRSAPAWTAIAGIGACIAILALAFTFTAHLHRDLSERQRYGWNWDVKIGAPALPDLAGQLTGPLRAVPGVTDLSVGAVTQVDMGGGHIDVLAMDSIVGHALPTIVAGRTPEHRDEIVLGARTMRMLHTRIGSVVDARIGTSAARYSVVGRGVFPEFGDAGQLGTGAFMTVDGLHRVLPTAPRDTFFIRLRRGGAVAQQEAELARTLAPLPAHVDARPEDLVNLSRGDGLLVLLGALLAALALLMLLHAVMTSVRAGARNHAVLRALGFSRGQSRLAVGWQSLTLAGSACVIGLPLGIATGRWLWSTYATRLGVATDAFLPASVIVIAAAGAFAVAVLASLVPAWMVTRQRVAVALRARD